jgi:uncharacterized lipoprotein YajG
MDRFKKEKIVIFFLTFLCLNIYSQNFISIGKIENNIILGPMAGNRNLAFGVKNILEEVLQDKDYYLSSDASTKIQIEFLYFDVKKNALQVGVYSKKADITQIIAKATKIKNNKIVKQITAKGTSKSITTSTLIISNDGRFSQTGVSTAIKKLCADIISKLKL